MNEKVNLVGFGGQMRFAVAVDNKENDKLHQGNGRTRRSNIHGGGGIDNDSFAGNACLTVGYVEGSGQY